MPRPLSVYVHIPFCAGKCSYCDFLSFSGMEGFFERYLEALSLEVKSRSGALGDHLVNTVFFGGGTPTLLRAEQISGALRIIKESVNVAADAEITIEANPGTVSAESLSRLRNEGFNRISFGLQSCDDRLLKRLRRIHNCEMFYNSYREAGRCGFENINVDIMNSLPGQSEADWERTLNYVIGLKPNHISAYGLILEEGTPLWRQVEDGLAELPDEETQLLMYHTASDRLRKAGYEHYEISNFARNGFRCKHNITYWRCGEYVGFGLGAVSRLGSLRFRNENDLGKYLECTFDRHDMELLGRNDAISEFMFLGLRMLEGVSRAEFCENFGQEVEVVYGSTVASLMERGLLAGKGDRIFLTKRGIDLSNVVFSELLL